MTTTIKGYISIFPQKDSYSEYLYLDKLLKFYGNSGFCYTQHVTDNAITKALNSDLLINIDADLEHEDDRWLRETDSIKDVDKHAFRVASVIQSIKKNGLKHPIIIDTMTYNYTICGIPDGHHRLRALEYMGYNYALFSLSGYMDEIEELVNKCRVDFG